MSLLCGGQGVVLPPKTRSEALRFDLCHACGSLLSFKFSGRKECHIAYSSKKRLNLSCSSYSTGTSFLCIPWKHGDVSQFRSDANEKFKMPLYDVKMCNPKKLSRYVVARSELTGTGSPSAAFPLTELNLGPKVRGICFYAVTSVVAIFLFVLMVLAHPFVLLFDRYRRKAHHLIAKYWASLTIIPFFKIEIEGLENLPPVDTPAVYVSNHQSFLDIYTLLTLGRPYKFISKTSIFLFPIIGWAMFLLGVIPLKRMDSKSQMDCLKRCMDLLRMGASVFFFPEGTRSKDGKLGAFKKGAFSVAAKVKAPVVPITLIGTGNLMPSGREGILNKGSVKVIIHKPIEGSNAQELCDSSRNVIAAGLNR